MKILLIRNNLDIDITEEVTSAYAWLGEKFGIPFEVEYMEVNWTNQFEFKVKNSQGFNIWGTTGIKEKVRSVIPEGKYGAVGYIFNPKTFDYTTGYLTGFTYWQDLLPGTGFFEIAAQASFNGRTLENYFTHEMMHVMRLRLHYLSKQYIEDVMDLHNGIPYDHDSDRDYPTGNYSAQFALFQPYLPLLTPPKAAILTRITDTGVETMGSFSYGSFTCDTLELPYKNNKKNISCILPGTYTVKWTFSPRFMRYTYEAQNVPGRSGIRIHYGNFWFNYQGCIGLGRGYGNLNNDGQVDLLNTRVTIKEFESMMNKKDFILEIK